MAYVLKKLFGWGGYRLEEIRKALVAVQADLANLKATVDALVDAYNGHVHTENTAATYTQNATTTAPPAASQAQKAPALNLTVE